MADQNYLSTSFKSKENLAYQHPNQVPPQNYTEQEIQVKLPRIQPEETGRPVSELGQESNISYIE